MKKLYRLGNIFFSITGEDKVLYPLTQELQSCEIKNNHNIKEDINFIFTRKQPDNDNYRIYAPIFIGNKNFKAKHSGFEYTVISDNNSYSVYIKSDELTFKQKLIPKSLYRFKNWNFLSVEEIYAKNFMYDIFDYITQIVNLQNNQTYIHASSFTKGNRGIMVAAWGGIGKTTTMLKLVNEFGWKYLSDDLGIIDTAGQIYRSPKKMQIYAYNLENQKKIKNLLMQGRNLWDKASWCWHYLKRGKKGVRRRVSAEELFGSERVAQKAKLTDFIFIERAEQSNFSVREISIENISKRVAATILKEIEPFNQLSYAINSATDDFFMPNSFDIYSQTENIVKSSLKNVTPILVTIPKNANPNELCEFLNENFDL